MMGVSGAVLFVPFYTIIFPLLGIHLQPVQAIQLGLFTELFGFLSSSSAFWRRGLIDFKIAGFALLFAMPTAVVGSYLANVLPGSWLLFITGSALLSFSYLLLKQTTAELEAESRASKPVERKEEAALNIHRDRWGRVYEYVRYNDARRAAVMSFGGLFQGLVGFSAGEFSTLDQILRNIPVRIATGSAHLILAGASLAAAGAHIAIVIHEQSSIPWPILVASVPGVLIGGQLAGFIAGRLPQAIMQIVMARFLMFISVVSLYRAALNAGYQLPIWILLLALLIFLGSVALNLRKHLALHPAQRTAASTGASCCSPRQDGVCKHDESGESALEEARRIVEARIDEEVVTIEATANESS